MLILNQTSVVQNNINDSDTSTRNSLRPSTKIASYLPLFTDCEVFFIYLTVEMSLYWSCVVKRRVGNEPYHPSFFYYLLCVYVLKRWSIYFLQRFCRKQTGQLVSLVPKDQGTFLVTAVLCHWRRWRFMDFHSLRSLVICSASTVLRPPGIICWMPSIYFIRDLPLHLDPAIFTVRLRF